MLITKETDYAIRLLRNLQDGNAHTVGEMAQAESVPQAFAYKILKKLEQAGFVAVTRGMGGGCRLIADLDQKSLYDLMVSVGDSSDLSSCTPQETRRGDALQTRLTGVQARLDADLQALRIKDIL